MTIAQILAEGSQQLAAAEVSTARLDCLVLLADLLKHDKSWLLAHEDTKLTVEQTHQLQTNLDRRAQHEPLAYILGYKEFYGHNFAVTPAVLIPRPETEHIIELLANLQPKSRQKLIDIGTGSGAIAISCKLLWPNLDVSASDISLAALKVAETNAKSLHATVKFSKSDLLENTSDAYDYIVANLPYVDQNWQRSPETNFEPALALFADDNGLDLIKKLLNQAKSHLNPRGYILLEADPRQMQNIEDYAKNLGYQNVDSRDFTIVLQLL